MIVEFGQRNSPLIKLLPRFYHRLKLLLLSLQCELCNLTFTFTGIFNLDSATAAFRYENLVVEVIAIDVCFIYSFFLTIDVYFI